MSVKDVEKVFKIEMLKKDDDVAFDYIKSFYLKYNYFVTIGEICHVVCENGGSEVWPLFWDWHVDQIQNNKTDGLFT